MKCEYTMSLKVLHLSGEDYCFELNRNGESFVAYGSYDNEGLGGLDHAPSQEGIDYIGAVLDGIDDDVFQGMLAAARQNN